MIPKLRTRILNCWDEWSLEGTKPYDLSFIRRSSTWLGDAGKIVFYIFRRGERQPILIGKTVRSSEYGDTIRREARNLFSVWERVSGAMSNAVPRPVALLDIEGLPVYLEEAIPGIALPERVMRRWTNRKRYEVLAEGISEAGTWLSRFVEVMGVERIVLGHKELETWFLNPIRTFRARIDLNPSEQKMLNALQEAVSEWKGVSFPLVAGQGDFWGGSLLWGDDGMRVIDWEFFQLRSLPLFDLFMLTVHPGVAIGKDRWELIDELRMCFEESLFSNRVREMIRALREKLELNTEAVRWLFPLFLVVLSNERDEAQKGSGCGERTTWAACFRYYVAHLGQIERLC